MSEEDLQKTDDSGTDNDSSQNKSSSSGQSEDYEARFKGLQRKFNEQAALLEETQTKLEAKTTVASEALATVASVKDQLSQTNVNYERQLSERDAKINQLTSTVEEKETKIASFETTLKETEENNALREQLSDEPIAMRFFDKGMLNLRDKDGKPLEGEAITARISEFKEELGQQIGADLKTTLGGTVPASKSPGTGPIQGANEDQLQAWLMANPDDPNYEAVNEQYTAAVEKRINQT